MASYDESSLLALYKKDTEVIKKLYNTKFKNVDILEYITVIGLVAFSVSLLFTCFCEPSKVIYICRFVSLFCVIGSIIGLCTSIYCRNKLKGKWVKDLKPQEVLNLKNLMKCDYGHFNLHTKIYDDWLVTSSAWIDNEDGVVVDKDCSHILTSKLYLLHINNSTLTFQISYVLYQKLENAHGVLVLNWKSLCREYPSVNNFDFYSSLGGVSTHSCYFDNSYQADKGSEIIKLKK